MTDFIKNTKVLTKDVVDKFIIFQSAIDKLSKHIQTKYPEVIAEYTQSDGGIIFIGLENTEVEGHEFYGIEDLIRCLGER